MRAARSAPVVSLERAAASAGTSRGTLVWELRRLGRGRCVSLAARTVDETVSDLPAATGAVLAHRVCPPGVARAAEHAMLSAPGTAGWGTRSGLGATMHGCRRVFAAGRGAERSEIVALPHAVAAGWADSDDAQRRVLAARLGRGPLLEKLAADHEPRVQLEVAANPYAPAGALEALAADRDSVIRGAAASNPAAPASLLESLAGDDVLQVRLAAARNSAATPLVLRRVVASVRVEAGSAGAPRRRAVDPLRRLAAHTNPSLREAAAANQRVGPVAASLSVDPAEEVRAALARNAACPPRVLARLAAGGGDGRGGRLSGDMGALVAANAACPPEVLAAMVDGSSVSASAAAAANAACPPTVLQKAATLGEWCRQMLATNPACPMPLLREMLTDRVMAVGDAARVGLHRRFAAQHPLRAPPAARESSQSGG